eukprot:TRINITY_DN241_c0_g1_i1.p1 TRINITY_DN241_c0_g1~~TRINITY_DN241_c0_g1_i1.p1  ORF type:complete len:145 (-),score=6.64 TRINITY_DN241_c0_g1_i1:62-496(-)
MQSSWKIELKNGCTEDGLVESGDGAIVNAVRHHYLQSFGHRRMDLVLQDYAATATVHSITKEGKHTTHHGLTEIGAEFGRIFKAHPEGESTFKLEHVVATGAPTDTNTAMVVWSATTPDGIQHGTEFLTYNEEFKIVKQMSHYA